MIKLSFSSFVLKVQGPWHHHQHKALLYNPLRPLYQHKEKTSQDAHEGCHCDAWLCTLHVNHTVNMLEDVGPSPYSLDLSFCGLHMFSSLKIATGSHMWVRWNNQGHIGAVVPAEAPREFSEEGTHQLMH